MSNFFAINSAQPTQVAVVQQIEAPRPPKAQSDHKPANPATSSRGPAVVLSGALAKAPERQQAGTGGGQPQPQPQNQETGQHINRLI